MTMTLGQVPVFLVGTEEYVRAEVTVTTVDVELDAQPVSIWINHVEYAAEWEGDAAATRRCRTSSRIDFSDWTPSLYAVAVEVTDSPEIPLIPAGYISVQPAP